MEWGLGEVDSPGESPRAGLSKTDGKDDYIVRLAEGVSYAMSGDDENGQQVIICVHAAMNWASSKQRAFVDNSNEKVCSWC